MDYKHTKRPRLRKRKIIQIHEIAEYYGVNPATVSRRLKKSGLSLYDVCDTIKFIAHYHISYPSVLTRDK
jgi:hypothetical protein